MEKTRINPFAAIISMFKTNIEVEQDGIKVEELTDSDYKKAGVNPKDIEDSNKRIEKMEKELNSRTTKYKVEEKDNTKIKSKPQSKQTKTISSKNKEDSDRERE